MASSLDRAVSLLIQRADLWEQLDHDVHDRLTGQPAPHGPFFAWLDRLVHDQGAPTPAALLAELDASGPADDFHGLAQRVRQFHDLASGDEARLELDVIVDRLRLEAVQDALERLTASGHWSDEVRARLKLLHEQQAALKLRLSRPPTASG